MAPLLHRAAIMNTVCTDWKNVIENLQMDRYRSLPHTK